MFGSLSDAVQHEGSFEHIHSRRELDRSVAPPAPVAESSSRGATHAYIPSIGTAQDFSPYPVHIPTGFQSVSNGSETLLGAQQSGYTRPPYLVDTPNPNWHSELHRWSTSPAGYFAVPGPSLPSDPPDTVYDLCGGAADEDQDRSTSDDEEDSGLAAARAAILGCLDATLDVPTATTTQPAADEPHANIQHAPPAMLRMLELDCPKTLIQRFGGRFRAGRTELANPLVRSDLVFVPQDNGKSLKCAANGRQWAEEVDASLAAPMVRKHFTAGHHNYFVHKPFLASIPADNNPQPQQRCCLFDILNALELCLLARIHWYQQTLIL
ncbi:hypothetical protein FRC07_010023 [Ceratobasidium sp. 392]|nr:hypothetical protein FRC07_010023 [Ceratobasidium sp. 392]